LYDVARASDAEAIEDFEDILKKEGLPKWAPNDPRLLKLQRSIEFSPFSSSSPFSPLSRVLEAAGLRRERGLRRLRREEIELIANYELDLLIRAGYLLDHQIDAVELKHKTEGGYKENLLKNRLEYRQGHY